MKTSTQIDSEDIRLGRIAKKRDENSKPEDYVSLEEAMKKISFSL